MTDTEITDELVAVDSRHWGVSTGVGPSRRTFIAKGLLADRPTLEWRVFEIRPGQWCATLSRECVGGLYENSGWAEGPFSKTPKEALHRLLRFLNEATG